MDFLQIPRALLWNGVGLEEEEEVSRRPARRAKSSHSGSVTVISAPP
jgi:hypothetical protein